MQRKKHLSSIANDVVQRCALELDIHNVDSLVADFEQVWKPETPGGYSRKFIEFCCSKTIPRLCQNLVEKINDGSFSRFTFDMMVSWEKPSPEAKRSDSECMAKESEDMKIQREAVAEQEDLPLFYTDIMPLLVNDEPSAGVDAFVWLGSLVPLVADVVNGKFAFEALTAATGYRLYFPAYDMLLKEIVKCMKHLQKQAMPKGVELADDEFILYVEGTASSQRVVRHIKQTSWPGRLTLTNYALYFEASGVISYEDALKIDLSKNIEHSVKPASTGPWGAPLFDKAILYESPELEEGVILEFPEITSSTRRDHWLVLVKEIMLMHHFLSKFQIEESHIQSWELHSRTILAIIRLHAAREMLRIAAPDPTKFLIFSLFSEVPKGDYVLVELADSLKRGDTGHCCSASSLLTNMNLSLAGSFLGVDAPQELGDGGRVLVHKDASLTDAVNQSKEEAEEISLAKATTQKRKDEGISESAAVLMELLSPLRNAQPWFQEVVNWQKPITTVNVIALTLLVVYNEWIGKAIAACLLWLVVGMIQARRNKAHEKHTEIVVSTASDQTAMESIVSAQYGLITLHEIMREANIALLKSWSIYTSKAYKHASSVMVAMVGLAIFFAMIPFKFIIMGSVLYGFFMTSKVGEYMSNDQGNRRLKEWWDSIPIIPVRVVDDKIPDKPRPHLVEDNKKMDKIPDKPRPHLAQDYKMDKIQDEPQPRLAQDKKMEDKIPDNPQPHLQQQNNGDLEISK